MGIWDEIIREASIKDLNCSAAPEIKIGNQCPNCSNGELEYNGLLSLICPSCGFEIGGCYT